MEIRSPAFFIGNTIPFKYTCDGDNISPPLQWEDPPQGTKSFALIVDDPDAPNETFTHWLVYNIPPDCRDFPEDVGGKQPKIPHGSLQGKNDFGELGYGGPCPPTQHGAHRYFFRIFALNQWLDLPVGVDKQQLLDAIEGSVIGKAELMGRYARETGGDENT
ncbi:YbhB/YbcL family Raf kinase inhibitor-like protein [Scytonema sp. UIC 10036]|uniref:YbhB/YbcL family Raf kinase inhibitor-like protein n=1 Tax=Scytonema sp. UIC 10036 TaxID=2304196 RepID=UPI0012DAC12E|nr:YbhB/YbcL family Raf kinase inhibitor-like protein [Scytonema sp. UIC 10036]MUG98871.1 YbhB/YbcL family Raf kinase inhibitor-like protein [Scytonema sp. UIC 10036]